MDSTNPNPLDRPLDEAAVPPTDLFGEPPRPSPSGPVRDNGEHEPPLAQHDPAPPLKGEPILFDDSDVFESDTAVTPEQPPRRRPRRAARKAPGGSPLPSGDTAISSGLIAASASASASRAGVDTTTTRPLQQPRRPGVLAAWLVLMLCLILAAPPLLVRLAAPDVTDPAEARTLTTTIHTWQRLADEADQPFSLDLVTPTLNGSPRWDQPPGATWTQMIGLALFDVFDPTTSTPVFITRVRMVSAFFALLVFASVFWAGYSIGGLKTAAFSALIAATLPVLVWYGRLGSTPILHTGWAMLAIASAVWAIRPLKPSPSVERQFIGWVACGLAMGAALLTAGPIALLTVPAPIVLILILVPGRTSHGLGVLAALLIAVLAAFPWALFAHGYDPQAWRAWVHPLDQPMALDPQSIGENALNRTGLLLASLMPWTVWLIGAIVQPFSTSSAGVRTRMFIGWSWFAYAGAIYLLLPGGDRAGTLLPLLPATAVLLGQLFRRYSDLAAEGRPPRFWRFLRLPHLMVITLVSAAVPAGIYFQDELIAHHHIDRPLFEAVPTWFALGLAGVLAVMITVSVHWINKEYPGRVLVCWAIWLLGLMATAAVPLAGGEHLTNPVRADGRTLASLPADTPLFRLVPSHQPRAQADPALLLYAARPMPPLTADQLDEAAEQHQRYFIVTSPVAMSKPHPSWRHTATLPNSGLTLWEYDAAAKDHE